MIILDIIIAVTLSILLGLTVHDDKHTEGESLLSIALQVEQELV